MATISDPSSSQFPDASTPQLFCSPSGAQMQIFIDPGGIFGRPKLVRQLKKSGAFICSDPKHAEVILVDSNSDTGRQFIRDWGQDKNKVILEHTWVTKSIAAGRLLQENDEWGGCGTVDDGLPIGKFTRDAMSEDTKSPLPTPRITPIEPSQPHHRRKRSFTESSSFQSVDFHRLPHRPPAESSFHADPTINGVPSHHQPSSPFPHGQGHVPQFSQFQPSEDSAMPSFAHVQLPQSTAMQQLLQPQSGPGNVLPFQSQMLMNSLGLPNSPVSEQSFAMSMLDILKAHGMEPWSASPGQIMQNSLALLPFFSQRYVNTAMQSAQDQQTFPVPFGTDPNISANSFHPPPSPEPSIASSSPRSQILSSSFRRKSPPDHPPSTRSRLKRKGKATSPDRSKRQLENAFSRSPSVTESFSTPTTQTDKIFTSKTGEELAFFVQIDLNNRLAVVSNIKKHGGKITNSHTIADYSILYSRSKTFPHLLKSTIAAKKPALTASFVHDSVADNELKDPEDYLFHPVATNSRKVRRSTSSEERQEMKLQRKREESRRRHAERKMTTEQNAAADEMNDEDGRPPHSAISPSPPPKGSRVKFNGDRYHYSDSERSFMTRYIHFLLTQDYLISNTAISHKLHSKIPHHSQRSWLAFISTAAVRDEIQTLRKKAGIAHRKAESADRARQERLQGEMQRSDDSGDPGPSKRIKLATSSSEDKQELGSRDLEEEDFNVICHFFATWGAGEDTDDTDVIWSRLSSQATCQSAPSWSDFYDKHHVEVGKRYDKLTEFAGVEDIPAS